MVKIKVPDKGDIIWIDFSPQAGHEQAGRRPALVLSPSAYNKKTNLLLACSITKNKKNYPFEVELPEDIGIDGVVLSDHIKNLDWKARNAEIKQKTSPKVVNEVLSKLDVLI